VLHTDKLFPNSSDNKKNYKGDEIYEVKLFDFIKNYSNFNEKDLIGHAKFTQIEMGSNLVLQSLLSFFAGFTNAKEILEIGTFTGASALALASGNKSAKITSIEKFREFAEVAKANFIQAKIEDRINLLIGDAQTIISDLPNLFDLIFIDGDKKNYKTLFDLSINKLSEKGLIIVDDVFFHGDVLNEHQSTEHAIGVLALLDHVKSQKLKYRYSILPISNGVLLLAKS
jgi:caffeoyl-CoA O-methyltransferase